MAFIDNPIIASIGSAIGLGPMFNSISGGGGDPSPAAEPPSPQVPPGASPPQARMVPPGKSKPNIPPYRNRPYVPRNISGGGAGAARGGPEMADQTAMMNQDTLNHPEVQELLGKFGVDPNSGSIDPHLFIHSAGLWDSHPHLAGALEGALTGAAFTRGGATVGESISNVLQGQLEGQAAHAQHINAQLMAPFAQAHQVAQLQNDSAMIDEHKAQIQHMSDMANYYKQIANNKDEEADIKREAQTQLDAYRSRQLDLESQLNDVKTDPIRVLQQKVQDKWTKGMIEKYGSEDNIPLQEILRFQHSQMQEVGRDKMGIRYDEFRPNSGNAEGDKKTSNQLGVLKDAYDHVDSQLKTAMDDTKVIQDESGRMLAPGSAARSAYVGKLKTQRDSIDHQRRKIAGIEDETSPAPTNTPQAAPSTPAYVNPYPRK